MMGFVQHENEKNVAHSLSLLHQSPVQCAHVGRKIGAGQYDFSTIQFKRFNVVPVFDLLHGSLGRTIALDPHI